ncbi:synaptic vesicle 2-related protein-like isoform X1 [Micropterus salmoides]|uniref:synaptic vesicle 2-related protein-like isoform X1 n=1 Tax=Micropterus salmoides TaxID=27706 RepID=UPI0018EA41F5|nr:synaptic vesicle 2-related protein-like isoform X1 [Micropterus salmoides]
MVWRKSQLSNTIPEMDKWSSRANKMYKRWRNPEERGDANVLCPSDEDQDTDTEICTTASARFNSGRRESASRSGFHLTEETFTVDEALEAIGFGKFQWKITFLAGLAWVAYSMEMMIPSILGPQLHCEWRLPSYKVALTTSVLFLGLGIGSAPWGKVSDKYGRKVGLTICMTWALFYGLLRAIAPVYGWLTAIWGFAGFGIGGAPQTVTLYTEFLTGKSRGTCLVMFQAFWAIGCVLEVLLALWIMPTLGWRWLLSLSTVPMAVFVCFCLWLPESPHFDMLTGRTEKAMALLTRIAKENGKAMPQGKMITYLQNDRGRVKDLFTPQYWRTTLLLLYIWFANAFCYYGIGLLTTELFQTGHSCEPTTGAKNELSCSLECKYLTSADYTDLLWTSMAEFPGILVILIAIDRIGRKKTLALCFVTFSLCFLPLFACIGRTTLTIFIFIARAFSTGANQSAFIYTTEVFPTENRALALGICSGLNSMGALITPFVAQVLLGISRYLTLSMYCGCGLLAGVACLNLPIETLGRGLQNTSLYKEAGEKTITTPSQPNGTTDSSDQQRGTKKN